MSRRVWTGILAGVLAAVVLLGVAGGAYRAGQHHEVVTRTVTDGQAVRVVEGHGWGFWPGPGIFLFPLLVIGIVFLVSRAAPWRHGRWHGPYGPGPYGPGPGHAGGPGGSWDDWHRRAHDEQAVSAAGGPGPSATGPA
jgi:hypothetical protein